MFDKDGDGAITSAELLGVMKSLGMDTSTEQVQQMIRRVDLDGMCDFIMSSQRILLCRN